MANKKKTRRPYNTFGRRILAVLESGARKLNVLIGLARTYGHGEKFARRTVQRLEGAGLVRITNRNRGGITVALAQV